MRYQIRLLQNLYPVPHPEDKNPPPPGTIEHHAGEVIILDAEMTVLALAEGWGALVGEVIDGIGIVKHAGTIYLGALPY